MERIPKSREQVFLMRDKKVVSATFVFMDRVGAIQAGFTGLFKGNPIVPVAVGVNAMGLPVEARLLQGVRPIYRYQEGRRVLVNAKELQRAAFAAFDILEIYEKRKLYKSDETKGCSHPLCLGSRVCALREHVERPNMAVDPASSWRTLTYCPNRDEIWQKNSEAIENSMKALEEEEQRYRDLYPEPDQDPE